MRRSSWTPSVVRNGHDQNVYLVVDDFGRLGRAYCETDVEEADLETVITGGNIMSTIVVGGRPLSEEEHKRQLTRAVIASTVGTAIEWYDFFLYGTVTRLVFAKLFFPESDPLTSYRRPSLRDRPVLR